MHRHHREDFGDEGRLGRAMRDTGELLRRGVSYAEADLNTGRDRLPRQWESAADRAGEWRDAATDGVSRLARATDQCAHRHAWESIAVAAVIGAITAFCLARRSMRR
jgi:ElaB/YqjD/DUF883 family membrane-anchored ribosome-binding protein